MCNFCFEVNICDLQLIHTYLIIHFILFLYRFSNTMMYFGLSLMTGALPGDRYLNFFFVAVLEVPATFVATWALNR